MAPIRWDPLLGARWHCDYAPHRRPPVYAGKSAKVTAGSTLRSAGSITRGERKGG
jgi:hypothetical protein